ncbi:MAG: hypothetical protein V1875_00445 [Candidatus Altiarchaeota archaeon]
MATHQRIKNFGKENYPSLLILLALGLIAVFTLIIYDQNLISQNNLKPFINNVRFLGLTLIILFLLTVSTKVLERPATVIVVAFIVSVFYLSPIYLDIWNMGVIDWDFTFTSILAAKISMLDYHQFPLWNPYICGGTSMIAAYQSLFLDPLSLTWLILPVPIAIKVNLMFYIMIGMIGCYLLAYHLRLGVYSRYYLGIVFMLSGFFAHRIFVGHVNMLVMMYLPLLLLYLMKSFEKLRYCIICSLVLTVFVNFGNPFPVTFLVVFLIVYTCVEFIMRLGTYALKKTRGVMWVIHPLISVLLIVVLCALVSGFRLLPLLEYYTNVSPYENNNPSLWDWGFVSPIDVYNNLADSHLAYGWHESNSYIGLVAFLFSIYGLFICYRERQYVPLIVFALLTLFISLGSNSPVPIWALVHQFPMFMSLRIPLRAIMFILFTLVILSARGLSAVESKDKKFSVLVVVFCLFILFTSNSRLFEDIFIIQPVVSESYGTHFKQVVSTDAHKDAYSWMYTHVLDGQGVTNCYMIGSLQNHAIPAQDGRYWGEVVIRETGLGNASILSFSPNMIVVDVNSSGKGLLILNQNFERNWKLEGGGVVKNTDGLISTDVDSTTQKVVFYYLPDTFIIGVFLSIIGLSICVLTIRRHGLSILW